MALNEFVTFVIFSDGCGVLEVGCAVGCAVLCTGGSVVT